MSDTQAASVAPVEPIARVLGQPFQDLPDDLYIPPDALEVFLDTFEGPLDLLLYLIRRQNLDILDIPIAQITRQYMTYIDMMDRLRLELAAEYLVMAAWLAEIKSRMLLPRQPESEDEEDDPRAFLIRKLQEYEAIKKVAEAIDQLPRHERDTFDIGVDTTTVSVRQILPDVAFNELLRAFQEVLKRAEQLSHHQITKEPLSVRERMAAILEKLDRTDQLSFAACFTRGEGKNGVVVAFLAILELAKECIIDIAQLEPHAGIVVRRRASSD
ncbi:MAG: segregation/condensation protein A [Methylomonas sp.]|nr:segregation/condensation protein A [Methylomonas sp.]PPD22538.1 MAG: segregation/condensation protein A [Methylomonas sp.]PPD27850.1 MAG: segregation/condensation protein A [Methylomonas sp.]PPD39959.1 MAG: segregation/condensation protein A [Methylomonas sp.]PPD41061.1 MAG: segregation/condensation protein A [Methylomonas sp.]